MLEIGEVVEFLNLEVFFVVFFNVILNVLKELDNFCRGEKYEKCVYNKSFFCVMVYFF